MVPALCWIYTKLIIWNCLCPEDLKFMAYTEWENAFTMSVSLPCRTEGRSLGVEIAKSEDFITSGCVFTAMPTEKSLLTGRVCRGREEKDWQREVKEEQRLAQEKEREGISRTRSLLIFFGGRMERCFRRRCAGGKGGRSQRQSSGVRGRDGNDKGGFSAREHVIQLILPCWHHTEPGPDISVGRSCTGSLPRPPPQLPLPLNICLQSKRGGNILCVLFLFNKRVTWIESTQDLLKPPHPSLLSEKIFYLCFLPFPQNKMYLSPWCWWVQCGSTSLSPPPPSPEPTGQNSSSQVL